MEDKLDDVFSLFHDGTEFKKKLERRLDRKLKIK
jgi:exonuclease VII small subunit